MLTTQFKNYSLKCPNKNFSNFSIYKFESWFLFVVVNVIMENQPFVAYCLIVFLLKLFEWNNLIPNMPNLIYTIQIQGFLIVVMGTNLEVKMESPKMNNSLLI